MTKDDLLILGKVVSRTWEDPAYKAELVANARKVLVEAGYIIRDDVTVTVQEGATGLPHSISEKEVVFPLPAKPEDASELEQAGDEIDESELENVAGGARYGQAAGFSRANIRQHFNIGNWMRGKNQSNNLMNCCW